jgi:Kef-type K+ transport system membrane component KefB/mannitol/fructose-specific phosphotransferase system IIA component (Ntr-type)
MPILTHQDIVIVLLGLGTLLAAARLLGELAHRFGQPAVIGEIVAGILLGPTVLGELWPSASHYLFPRQGNPAIVLQGLAWVAVVMFLLVAGMEVDLSRVFRQGKAAMAVSVSGIAAPFLIGLAAALSVPDFFGSDAAAHPHTFALFFATALAISALPVIAKTLMDLNLYRSDLGMVVIAAAIFDDLVGWIIFAVVLGMMSPEGAQRLGGGVLGGVSTTIALTLLFVLIMLTIGRWVLHAILPWIQANTVWPGGVLGFSMALALFGASFTEWIGIHAVFGSFIVGVALGDSAHLRQRTRTTIDQFVSFIFAPLFFASIGLRVNFVEHFDWLLTLVVLAIAIVSKVGSCGLGARLAGMSWRESWAIGFGMNARGAMGIILGLLALEAGVIGPQMFVALVFMAIITSIMSGSMMQAILRRKVPRRFVDYLHQRGFIHPLNATDREAAIGELSRAASSITGLNAEAIEAAVLQRERMMSTGLGLCVAVPHGRVRGMHKPVICVGLSPQGIEFDAPDGERSRMIFLILTPSEDDGAQLELLADISRTFLDASLREQVLRVNTFNEFLAALRTRSTGTTTGVE